jgi:hypothetical protein
MGRASDHPGMAGGGDGGESVASVLQPRSKPDKRLICGIETQLAYDRRLNVRYVMGNGRRHCYERSPCWVAGAQVEKPQLSQKFRNVEAAGALLGVEIYMRDVLSIRKVDLGGSASVTDVIERAYRKSQLLAAGLSAIPRQRACTVLINSIVDSAARGMRDVDQLCGKALESLRSRSRV